MTLLPYAVVDPGRRSPHGERGLKSGPGGPPARHPARRSPHGERGLKLLPGDQPVQAGRSLPSRGAWIEMLTPPTLAFVVQSLPSRGAWIEILHALSNY